VDLLDEQIAPLERELRPLARADSRAALLETIPGVGDVLGLTIAAEIGDVARFANPRKLIDYAGLAPRVKQSGESSRTGPLSKAGRRSRPGGPPTPGTGSTSTSSGAPASPTPPSPPWPATC
jgi:transposase